jgi:hypothetical protein
MNLEKLFNLMPVMAEDLKPGSFVYLHNNLVKIDYVIEFSKKSTWIFYIFNGCEHNITKPKNYIIKQLKKNPQIWT